MTTFLVNHAFGLHELLDAGDSDRLRLFLSQMTRDEYRRYRQYMYRGHTWLQIAVIRRTPLNLVRVLLAHEQACMPHTSLIDNRGKYGMTPLQLAVVNTDDLANGGSFPSHRNWKYSASLIALLLAFGASRGAVTKDGEDTVFHLAVAHGAPASIIELLAMSGSVEETKQLLSIKNRHGRTPLGEALRLDSSHHVINALLNGQESPAPRPQGWSWFRWCCPGE